jgi:subtilisin
MIASYCNERPRHIVIFREPGEQDISVISKVLGVSEVQGMSTRASCTVLESSGNAHPRVYSRLGIAVADFAEDQIETLQQLDRVLDVIPNEIRTLPPFYFSPEGLENTTPSVDTLSAYLQGMQDAISAIQRFRLGEDQQWSPVLPQLSKDLKPHSWCLEAMGVNFSNHSLTGQGVCVAVLDTGIDLYHPDFRERVVPEDNARSFVIGESVQDSNGHGTHCVGVVAGPVQSCCGKRYGVASDVNLLVGKVLNHQGYGHDDQILDAIDWAEDQGAQIISMSFGSDRNLDHPYTSLYEQVASILLERNILVIAAAGNSSSRPFYRKPVGNPAACPSIKSVAAVGRQGQIAPFSCAQLDEIGCIDISAPGIAVYSAWMGGDFRSVSGTSMATPHIAGAIALYYQHYPDYTAKKIWDLVRTQALPLGEPEDFGCGLIQVPG